MPSPRRTKAVTLLLLFGSTLSQLPQVGGQPRSPSSGDINRQVEQRQACETVVQTEVNRAVDAAGGAAVDMNQLAAALAAQRCSLSLSDLREKVQDAVSQVIADARKSCTGTAADCRQQAAELASRLQGGAAPQGQGQQQELLEQAAASNGLSAVASCLENATLSPSKLRECRQQAQQAYEESGGLAANFDRELQQQAERAALEPVLACLEVSGANGTAQAASYRRSQMDSATAAAFASCLQQGLSVLTQQGGAGDVSTLENALQRRVDELTAVAQQACLSRGGDRSSCSRQAKDALRESGVPPAEVNKRMQDNAAQQAASALANCRLAGGNATACGQEARSLFDSLGGDSAQTESALRKAVANLAAQTAAACRAAAAGNATALQACDAAAAASFEATGGSAQDFKQQRDKAAGEAAAAMLRDCVKSSSDRRACTQQAQAAFAQMGASLQDFERRVKDAAEEMAASTQQACLQDAGCVVNDRTGRQSCSNQTAAALCFQEGQKLLREAKGKASVSATELKVAAQKASRAVLAGETSGCAATKLAEGTVQVTLPAGGSRTCEADDSDVECRKAAAAACKESARQAYLNAGGSPSDFQREQLVAARSSMAEKLKGCVQQWMDASNNTVTSGSAPVVCTWDSTNSSADLLAQCLGAARRACDDVAVRELAQAGGRVEEYARQRSRAAAAELADSVSACVESALSSMGNATTPTGELAEACSRLGGTCSDAASLRQAAAVVCKKASKAAFLLAGGDPADLELQARRQARAAAGDAYRACQQLSDTELTAAGVAVSGPTAEGRRRAACLEEARSTLRTMGLGRKEVHRELRRTAALQAAERVRICMEDAGFGVATFEAAAVDLAAGDMPGADLNLTAVAVARDACRASAADAVQQAGGPRGSLQKLFMEGPRLAASEVVRECVRAVLRDAAATGTAPDVAAEQRCRELGAATFMASGGEPARFAEELLRAARAMTRESIWACLAAGGFDVLTLRARAWGKNQTARAEFETLSASCRATALDELVLIAGNLTGSATNSTLLGEMRREAAQEELEAQLDSDGGAVRSVDEAAGSLAALGAESPNSAEAELAEQMGCQPYITTLCPNGTVGPLLMAGSQVCCSQVPVQPVNLSNATVVEGAGEVLLSGSGDLAAAQSELERYCLGSADATSDPSCQDVTQQTAASVSTDGGTLSVQGTTVEAGGVELGPNSTLDTGAGSGRRLQTAGRAARSGYLQATAAVVRDASLSGQGRVDLGRAEVRGELRVDADTAASSLSGPRNSTVRVRGRLVLSPELAVNGSSSGAQCRISVEGADPLVVDASQDATGDAAGLAAMQSLSGDATTGNRSNATPAACLRACRQDASIQTALVQCRNNEVRVKGSALNRGGGGGGPSTRWASDVQGIDCGSALKSCVRRCNLGPGRFVMRQQLASVAVGTGGVTAGPGVFVEVGNLELNATGAAPLLLGTPDDQAAPVDESGQPLGGRRLAGGPRPAALTIRNLTGVAGRPVSAGCDLSGYKTGDLASTTALPCVEMPFGATVSQLVARVPQNSATEAVTGRRVVRFSGGNTTRVSGGRRLQSQATVTITVLDASGNDVSSSYKTCCFQDGYGVAPLSASATECPPCGSGGGGISASGVGRVGAPTPLAWLMAFALVAAARA